MRPLFTVHAGEFLVGEFIERNFPELHVWIPSKDTGIDLLATNKGNSATVSLQVKLSRDYKKAVDASNFDKMTVATGWLSLSHEKIAKSTADYWVFVLVSHERKTQPNFIVIPPAELLRCLVGVNGQSERYQFYPCVTTKNIALDSRGLTSEHKEKFVDGTLELGDRNLSIFLNNWNALSILSGYHNPS